MSDVHNPSTDMRDLRVLEEIERNPRISQRQLAGELGVALGVANACIHTLVRKGLIKIRGESNRSLTYHLTKSGLAHKAALAVEWTNNTISDYVRTRAQVRRQLDAIAESGVRRIILIGADEVAELIALVAPQAGITVLAAVPVRGVCLGDSLAGVPVVAPEALDVSLADAAISAAGRIADIDFDLGELRVIGLDGQWLDKGDRHAEDTTESAGENDPL